MVKSAMQKTVSLSVTEAELMEGVTCAQDMLYTMRVLESIGLCVELPMVLEIDNSGAVDIANDWSISSRTRHVDTRLHFLREMKELNLIKTIWIPGDDNEADMFTKNLSGPNYNRHAEKFCGKDSYYKNIQDRESVGA